MRPLFIIVPASFVTPPFYDKLHATISAKGYDANVIDLPSANNATVFPAPTVEVDVAAIRTAVLNALDDPNDPRDVVLTVHSYAGIPGSSAVEGLSRADRAAAGKATAVTGIVYMAAFVADVGESPRKVFKDMQEPYKTGVPGGYLPAIPREYAGVFFNDMTDEDEITRLHAYLTRQSSDTYSGEVTYAAWRDIPSVQIIPGKDLVIPTAVQEEMYEKAVETGGKVRRVLVEGAGHAINASQTDLVAGEMVRQAEEGC